MKRIILIACLPFVFLASCKKSSPANNSSTDPAPVASASTLDLLRDSVYLYAKEDYYWYSQLPDYKAFNPRSYTGSDDLDALQTELDRLSQYAINPATSKPYEYYATAPGEAKYSFIDDGTASARLNAVSGDFGFAPIYNTATDIRVKYVYAGSPADKAGIKRGDQITSINGRTNLTYDANSGSANVNYVINAYANSSSITMILKHTDGTPFTVSMTAASYKVNPVIISKVLTVGTKKVGYIVFNSFVTLSSTQSALSTAFGDFAAQGITDLVVDLRYNGGGYVETSEYLANLIAPTAANSQLMYSTYYNDILTGDKETLLKNQVRRDESTNQLYNYAQINYSLAANQVKFNKQGSLNLSRVFFIVTGSTASASELTINNLRPYMNVQLIGNTTYGKPVGFFDIDIGKYEMFTPEFETKNSKGQGGYYAGMTPATTDYPGVVASDDPTKEFGDPAEKLLALALNYVNKGTYVNQALQIQSTGTNALSVEDQNTFAKKSTQRDFNGMVITRHVLKK